jgi:hypothetical protein
MAQEVWRDDTLLFRAHVVTIVVLSEAGPPRRGFRRNFAQGVASLAAEMGPDAEVFAIPLTTC